MRLFPVVVLLSLLYCVTSQPQMESLRRGRPHHRPSSTIKQKKLRGKSSRRFTTAQKEADTKQKERDNVEDDIIKQHKFLSGSSSSSRHQAFRRVPKELRDKGRMASEIPDATDYMITKNTKHTDVTVISSTSLGKTACLQVPDCDFNNAYRTMDGTCNNRKNPLAGAAGTPLIRLMQPAYSDTNRLQAPRIGCKANRELSEDRRGKKGGKPKGSGPKGGGSEGSGSKGGRPEGGKPKGPKPKGPKPKGPKPKEPKPKGNKPKGNGNGNNNGGSSQCDELPSARLVSNRVFTDLFMDAPDLSLMFMQWGQFLDHDLDLTPVNTIESEDGEALSISCCDNGELMSPSLLHTECFPIVIPKQDTLYGTHGRTCMNFVRSLPAANSHCTMGQREQMNGITSFIDGSMIYGSSDAELEALRSEDQRYRLKTQDNDLLPKAQNTDECPETDGNSCFKAGDIRVNEQTGLAMIHTLWMREHNRIADYLKSQLNKDDDEILFMTRKIVGAQIQHITYNEFLPILLGNAYMNENSLLPVTDTSNPYHSSYDENVDPGISNVFATAAFRFGHSMIQGMIKLYKSKTSFYEVSLRSQFFNPFEIYNNDFRDDMCRGLTLQSSQKMDRHFTSDIMGHLFQAATEPVGLDLPALNIQRGRDHGLPSYNQYRELCGLEELKTFSQLAGDNSDLEQRLKDVYDKVDYVDVFVGGILELPHQDSILGPTFQCLIGEQFERLKNADRYFYENKNQPKPFSIDQLNEIKSNAKLARIFCENAPGFSEVPLNVFKKQNIVTCDQLPRLDLSKFLTL